MHSFNLHYKILEMKNRPLLVTALLCSFTLWACGQQTKEKKEEKKMTENVKAENLDTAIFGAGCFWCVEAQFQLLNGVMKVESGFSGGHVKNPAYREVCNGTTGHAEVCRITYDKTKLSYTELLEAFFKSHDPTQLNKQGNDVGTQYRSVIFYNTEVEKQTAEKIIAQLNSEKVYDGTVVTEVSPRAEFYKAEDYHQNYFNENGGEGYCRFVIQPKVEKFRKVFADKLKK